MSTTAEIQAYVRANTATAYSYEGDLHALCDLAGVPAGHLLERLGALLETLPQGVPALLQNGSVEELLPILAPFSPASLFANGEQGVWYDPSDFSTMFQDAAGTRPVTAMGQPVGLILDKSKGLVLGPELVTNGGFDSADGWVITQPTIWAIAGGKATCTAGGSSIRQTNRLVVGKWYKIEFDILDYSSGSVQVLNVSQSTVFSSGGKNSAIVLATGTDVQLFALSSTNLSIDNISIRELPGNHATQATTTSRPTLQQDTSGKYYLSFDGVDDSLSTGSVDFTATDKMTVCAGVLKLSDAEVGALVELSTVAGSQQNFSMNAPRNAGAGSYGITLRSTDDSNANVTQTGYSAPISNVLIGQFDYAAADNKVRLRVNGVLVGNDVITGTPTGNFGNYPLYIGRRGGTSLPFNGRLYDLIVRGAATDATQLAQTEQWINSKMGGIY